MNINNPEIITFLNTLTWQGVTVLWIWTFTVIGATYKVIRHFQPVVHTDKAECELFKDYANTKSRSYKWLELTRHNQKAIHINCPLFEGKNKCSERENGKCKFFG
jgi:ABC-type siderophore export system fused ATPase/permease subunit